MVVEEDKLKCIYKDKCTELGHACKTCLNNKGKKSYYVPKNPRNWRWFYPWGEDSTGDVYPPRLRWYCTYESNEE